MVGLLVELYVENFAIIDSLRVEFGPGLNVMTGETGAGKSIIADATSLLLGGRGSSEYVRDPEKRALVEGVFLCPPGSRVAAVLEEAGVVPEEDKIWLSREIGRGRTTCRLNMRVVPLSLYQEVGRHLVDLHGQYDHGLLLSPSRQLELLDAFGGGEVETLRREVAVLREAALRLEAEMRRLGGDTAERKKNLDFLRHQVDELEKAGLQAGEEEELLKRREAIKHAEKILLGTQRLAGILYRGDGSVLDGLYLAGKQAREIACYNDQFGEVAASLDELAAAVEDVAARVRHLEEKINFDSSSAEEIEERLHILRQLKRKYGGSVEEIIERLGYMREEIAELERAEERIGELESERARVRAELEEKAGILSARRREIARRLTREVEHLMAELELRGAFFGVNFRPKGEIGPRGVDEVEFVFSANPGEPPRSLAKVASGGELSRLMLALKAILAHVDDVPTVVLDEIDVGIGGRTANALARVLVELAGRRQTICITHLAQLAAVADRHLVITKTTGADWTRTEVRQVEGEDRVRELVRMLGGLDTAEAWEHARSLLKLGKLGKREGSGLEVWEV